MKNNPKEWHVSESFRKLNPHVYSALGPLEAHGTKPSPLSPLVVYPPKGSGSSQRVVARIHLIAIRKQLLDPDAVAFACKPATDAIAKSLGVDDADPRVEWIWSQAKCGHPETQGLIVKLEIL